MIYEHTISVSGTRVAHAAQQLGAVTAILVALSTPVPSQDLAWPPKRPSRVAALLSERLGQSLNVGLLNGKDSFFGFAGKPNFDQPKPPPATSRRPALVSQPLGMARVIVQPRQLVLQVFASMSGAAMSADGDMASTAVTASGRF